MNKRIQINHRKRQKVFERDNFKCQICGCSGDFNALEVDHIIAVVDGGDNDYNNLQTLCYKCNMDKRFKKNTIKSKLLDLSPLQRLDIIKKRLLEYKNLTYPEFKVVYTQDKLFKILKLDLLYIGDLFLEIYDNKSGACGRYRKDKESRDRFIRYIYENKDILELTQDKIAEIGCIGAKTVWSAINTNKSDDS